MSDTVWIVLIVAIVILIVLYLFRSRLSRFVVKASKGGIEADLQTRDSSQASEVAGSASDKQASVNISGNRQIGRRNVIEVGRGNINIAGNTQLGEDQKITTSQDTE